MNYDVVIVGNGILGTTLAYLLSKENLSVALIGPKNRGGSASMAAAAMLNVFAEVDGTTLKTSVSRYKLKLATEATRMWSAHLDDINQHTDDWQAARVNYGTHIIFNHCSNDMHRYTQIKEALRLHGETYQEDVPLDGYFPENECKAYKSVYLPNEGYINPERLMSVLDKGLEKGRVTLYDDSPTTIEGFTVTLRSGGKITGGKIVVAAGAFSEHIIRNSFYKHNIQQMFYGSGSGILVYPERHSVHEPKQTEVIRTPVRAMSCGLFAVPQEGGLYIGASNHVSRTPVQIPRTSTVMALLNQACAQINKDLIRSSFFKTTMGHRPITVDGFPLIGEIYDGVFIMTGTKRDGFHMSPLYAKDMANRVLGKIPYIDDTFNPLREPIKTITVEEGIEDYAITKCNHLYVHGTRMPDNEWGHMKKRYREEATKLYDRLMITYGLDPGVLEAW